MTPRANMKAHPLNDPKHAGASLLVVNKNFGCGSSREHAPQGILRWGIRAIIGESFAEIFAGNCTAIGLPVVTASEADVASLMAYVVEHPEREIEVDLVRKEVRFAGQQIPVEIRSRTNAFSRGSLGFQCDALVRHGRRSSEGVQPAVFEMGDGRSRDPSPGRQMAFASGRFAGGNGFCRRGLPRGRENASRHLPPLGFVRSGACVDSTSEWNEGEEIVIQVLLDKRTLLGGGSLPQLVWKRMFSKTHQYGLKFREYPKNCGLIQNFVREYEARYRISRQK